MLDDEVDVAQHLVSSIGVADTSQFDSGCRLGSIDGRHSISPPGINSGSTKPVEPNDPFALSGTTAIANRLTDAERPHAWFMRAIRFSSQGRTLAVKMEPHIPQMREFSLGTSDHAHPRYSPALSGCRSS